MWSCLLEMTVRSLLWPGTQERCEGWPGCLVRMWCYAVKLCVYLNGMWSFWCWYFHRNTPMRSTPGFDSFVQSHTWGFLCWRDALRWRSCMKSTGVLWWRKQIKVRGSGSLNFQKDLFGGIVFSKAASCSKVFVPAVPSIAGNYPWAPTLGQLWGRRNSFSLLSLGVSGLELIVIC